MTTSGSDKKVAGLVDHLFRHQAGRMVSTLTRIFGPQHLDLAEEVVQDSLIKALEQWPFRGIP
ncbi:MAG: sigma factor, ECF subfamily protein, partial [Blastocatellia bacterium]|nr:sigma factor, ECF subfamily protein [Blastocatellia bacterium]